MTQRERMLAAIRGEPSDALPWAPRMDLWYIAACARGTLPRRFAGLDMAELAEAMGVACHAVRADFTRPREPSAWALRALGIENHPDFPYRVELHGLPCTFEAQAGVYRLNIRTPAGEICCHYELTAEMAHRGISLPFVKAYALPSLDKAEALAHVFEHLRVVPTPEAYRAFQRRVGERGLAVAGGPLGASPMHLLLHDLMPMDRFLVCYMEEREALQRLAERMTPFYESILETVAGCAAEVVFWGANYDQELTWPPFFRDEIAPWLRRASQRLHAAGKFLLTHADGENQKLLPLYPACGFDVAESVCPRPMTRCSLAEARAGMGPRTTVWGGLPAVAFLADGMDEQAFETYLRAAFAELGTGERLILGVSDNVPPGALFERLERVKALVASFGPIVPGAPPP